MNRLNLPLPLLLLVASGCLRLGLEQDPDAGPGRPDADLEAGADGDTDGDTDGDVDLDVDLDTIEVDVDCPEGTLFYGGACRQLCVGGQLCPEGQRCVTVVCLPGPDVCSSADDCEGGLCQCADPMCDLRRCSSFDCGCQYDADGDGDCDGVLLRGVDNVADSCGPALSCNGLGGCERALGQLCELDDECQSGHCADGVCCAEPCDGDCDRCGDDGLCLGVSGVCAGECAACLHVDGAFRCSPDDAVCDAICQHGTCEEGGEGFNCDFAFCGYCATSEAPNFSGQCRDGIDVLLPTSCRYSYEYWWTNGSVQDWGFSTYECRDGTWAFIESDDDGDICHGACEPEQSDTWSDTCGDESALTETCPS